MPTFRAAFLLVSFVVQLEQSLHSEPKPAATVYFLPFSASAVTDKIGQSKAPEFFRQSTGPEFHYFQLRR
jgi:hypothetical protein